MKIMFYRGDQPNFGDELNHWMWPKIFPNLFDENERELFIGIGSVLGAKYSATAKKIVFGAGFVSQYHGGKPNVHTPDWKIYFVRGPRTTHELGLPQEFAIADSGILLRTVIDTSKKSHDVVSFMPHWQSLNRGKWEAVCKLAGINLIDPRWSVEKVIAELLRSRLVVTEAMHGAIISDAFRIPWVPVLPIHGSHRAKWMDWADSLNLSFKHPRLWPSSLREVGAALMNWPALERTVASIDSSIAANALNKAAIYIAAQRLSHLAKLTPSLSEDREMERVTERMLEKAELFRRDCAAAKQ